MQDWTGERVWCNPPYGRIQRDFMRKAAQEEADVAVLLVPARTETRAWQDWIFPCATAIRFLRGRVNFLAGTKRIDRAPYPSALVIFVKGGTHNRLTIPEYC